MPISQQKFWFVTGKGGVGKSTVAAALAVGLAGHGRRVLLCTSGDATAVWHLLSAAFGYEASREPSGLELVAPGLWSVHIDPGAAVLEYGAMILKSRWASEAVFGNRAVRRFIEAVPGIQPWAVLGKAAFHSSERCPDDGDGWGSNDRFDAVILDAPSTGHALQMLRVPMVLSKVGRGGPLGRDAIRIWDQLRDRSHTATVLVSLLEDLPTNETLELAAELEELGVPLSQLVLNRTLPWSITPAERAQLASLKVAADATASDSTVSGSAETVESQPDSDTSAPGSVEASAERSALSWAVQQAKRHQEAERQAERLARASALAGVPIIRLPNVVARQPERMLNQLAEQLMG